MTATEALTHQWLTLEDTKFGAINIADRVKNQMEVYFPAKRKLKAGMDAVVFISGMKGKW